MLPKLRLKKSFLLKYSFGFVILFFLIFSYPTRALALNPITEVSNSVFNFYYNYILSPLSEIWGDMFYVSNDYAIQPVTPVTAEKEPSKETSKNGASVNITAAPPGRVILPPNSPVTYVTNNYPTTIIRETTPTTIIRETVSENNSNNNLDASSFVSKILFDNQVDSIFDSIESGVEGLSDSLSEEVSTELLTVSGNATIGGDLIITGTCTGCGDSGDALTTDPLSQFAATTSLQLAGVISDETGSGLLVFSNSPVFTTPNIGAATATSITTSLVIGGTGTTSDLSLQTTSGVGALGADMHFLVGNNGSTEAMTILNSGNVGIGTASPSFPLHIQANTNAMLLPVMENLSTGTSSAVQVGFLTPATGGTIGVYNSTYTGFSGYEDSFTMRSLGTSSNGINISAETTGPIKFWTNLSERARFSSTGQLGINTTGPDRRLDILDVASPQLRLTQTDGSVYNDFQVLSTGVMNISPSAGGGVSISPAAATSNAAVLFNVSGPAHTTLVNAEAPDVQFGLSRTVQFGQSTALALQRALVIYPPTYASSVATKTITDAATMAIVGAPVKSTNIALTNTHALLIQAGEVSTATNSYGLTVNAQSGATNNYAATFLGGNVGIGTAAPDSKLHVIGAQGGIANILTDFTDYDAFYFLSNGALAGFSNISLSLNAEEGLVVTQGSSSLAYSRFGTAISHTDSSGTIALDTTASAEYDTTDSAITSYGGKFSNSSTRTSGSNALTNVGLYATATSGQNNYAAIFDQGNVGIGTMSPGQKLHVNATTEKLIQLSSSGAQDWFTGIGTADQFAVGYLVFGKGDLTAETYDLALHGDGIVDSRVAFSSPAFRSPINGVGTGDILSWTNTGGNFNGYLSVGAIHTNNGTTESSTRIYMGDFVDSKVDIRDWSNNVFMTVLRTGNVGIGTATPGVKLAVTQAVDAGAVVITSNSTSTGDIVSISGTGLSSGSALKITGPSTVTGFSGGLASISGNLNNSGGSLVALTPTFAAQTNGDDTYGIKLVGTDAGTRAATTGIYNEITYSGNAAKTMYGYNSVITSTSTVAELGVYGINQTVSASGSITEGARSVYGLNVVASADTASSGGDTDVYGLYSGGGSVGVNSGANANVYGLYIQNTLMNTNGTTNQYGLYVSSLSGADNNYAAVFAGGNVGVGDTTPEFKLDVEGDTADYIANIFNDGNDASRNGIQIQGGADDGSGATTYINALDGDGTQVGHISNTAGTFALTDISDVRTKTNIQNTTIEGMEIVNNLRVVDFNRLSNPDGPLITGFIAQEVEGVYPNIVTTGQNGYLGITKENLIPVLVKAIQEMDLKISDFSASQISTNSNTLSEHVSTFFNSVLQKVENGVAYMRGLVTETLTIGSPEKRTGITLYDEITGEPHCISIANGEQKITSRECAVIEPASSSTPTPESTPEPETDQSPAETPESELESTPTSETTPEPEPDAKPTPPSEEVAPELDPDSDQSSAGTSETEPAPEPAPEQES